MRVISYTCDADEKTGVLIDGVVYDIAVCSSFFKLPPLPLDLKGIIASGQSHRLRELHDRLAGANQRGDDLPPGGRIPLEEVHIRPPISRPGKLICLGLNYRSHASEQGAKIPETPLLFVKAPTAVIGHGQPIVIPRGASKVDYEGEVAFVIGARVKGASPDQAEKAIFGYCCMNDVTEREIQFSEKQWFRGKSFDTFAPLGPWITTADQVDDPLDLKITTKVNSRVMQSGSTSDLIFSPVDIVAFVSRTITLEPGDVISTGTPSGVGVFREPQVFLKPGDLVEITVDGIGTLSNPVVEES